MRMLMAVLLTLPLMAGCRGYSPGPDPTTETASLFAGPLPSYSNDGWYDGGMLDQDLTNTEPGRRP